MHLAEFENNADISYDFTKFRRLFRNLENLARWTGKKAAAFESTGKLWYLVAWDSSHPPYRWNTFWGGDTVKQNSMESLSTVHQVGAVLFNVEYALYKMDVFHHVGLFSLLGVRRVLRRKYSLESSWRDLQDLHYFAPPRLQKYSNTSRPDVLLLLW